MTDTTTTDAGSCWLCKKEFPRDSLNEVRWGAFGAIKFMCADCESLYHRQQAQLEELSPPPRVFDAEVEIDPGLVPFSPLPGRRMTCIPTEDYKALQAQLAERDAEVERLRNTIRLYANGDYSHRDMEEIATALGEEVE